MKSIIMLVCFVMVVGLAGISSAGLVTDDFEDGNYTANPQWNILSDQWEVVSETGGNDYLRMKNQTSITDTDGQIYTQGSPAITNGFELTMKIRPLSPTLGSTNYQRVYIGDKNSWTGATTYNNSYFFQVTNYSSGTAVQIQKWLSTSSTRVPLAQTSNYTFTPGSWVDVKFTYDKSLTTNNLKLYLGDMLTPYLTATDDGITNEPLLTTFDSVVLHTRNADNYQWGIDDVSVVPEPATMVLLGLGGLLLGRKRA